VRIAFVTPEYVTEQGFDGGLANHLGRVCPALAAMGHQVHVLVASERDEELSSEGVQVHRVAVPGGALQFVSRLTRGRLPTSSLWFLQSWALRRACRNLHRLYPLDVIQYASYSATALFRLKDVPAVVRISSYEPFWHKAYGLFPSMDHRLMIRLDRAAFRRADALFAPSRVVGDLVAADAGRPVRVMEPPIFLDRSGWDEAPYRSRLAGRKYLLFFGSVGMLKGVGTIAEVIGELLQAYPDLHFVFIGKDSGYRGAPMMQHVLEKAGSCRERVLYLGQMRHGQIHPILSHATAVVLPSLADNLPNTCLEAMALERVVIGTRGTSFEQLIEDGRNGFLCEPDSPETLLASMKRALDLPEDLLQAMGERAAQRMAGLAPECSLPRLVDFYREVCEQRGGRC